MGVRIKVGRVLSWACWCVDLSGSLWRPQSCNTIVDMGGLLLSSIDSGVVTSCLMFPFIKLNVASRVS
jgi:hypothetical protein